MTASSPAGAAPPPPLMPRTLSRIAAVQALYQMDMSGDDLSDVIEQFQTNRLVSASTEPPRLDMEDENGAIDFSGADRQFFADVLHGVVRCQREIDPLVDKQLATGWRLVRVDSILRAILRAGVYELLERKDVPVRVAINEYVNVGHAFFSGDEPRVINGVLHALAEVLRAGEMRPHSS